MKFINANPSIFDTLHDLAQANPLATGFVATALLMAACWKLKDLI